MSALDRIFALRKAAGESGWKGLTLLQPWASLLFPPVCWSNAAPFKFHETRSWSTSYRGPLVITASAKMDRSLLEEDSIYSGFLVSWEHEIYDDISGKVVPAQKAWRARMNDRFKVLQDLDLPRGQFFNGLMAVRAWDHEIIRRGSREGDWMKADHLLRDLPLGCAIGIVDLEAVQPVEQVRGLITSDDFTLGDYSDGRFAWRFGSPVLFPIPISCKGALGIWNLKQELADDVQKQCRFLFEIQGLPEGAKKC